MEKLRIYAYVINKMEEPMLSSLHDNMEDKLIFDLKLIESEDINEVKHIVMDVIIEQIEDEL
jgi:hypothetical protein